jgi:hypothetical protein
MNKRSPIEAEPLRLPGDSSREQLVSIAFNDLLPALMTATSLSVMAVIEWQASIHHWPRHPVLYSDLAGAAIAVCVWRFMLAQQRIRALQLGRKGEICVAALLDGLQASGARVFHDIPLKGGNIDHVVLSTRGFYPIETKTRSKPVGRRAEVSVRGDHVEVDGWKPDRDPLSQIHNSAQRLQRLLANRTKKQFDIKGVVLFPGWWVHRMDAAWLAAGRPWVLNPEAFVKWVAGGRELITPADVHLGATHLEEYIRAEAS